MSLIEIWGGRARTGTVRIEPFSDLASKECKRMTAYLQKFPQISYSTKWGDWDHSNSEFFCEKIASLGGGRDNIPGKIIQMLGGPYYKPPIMTDKWTQLTAELDDAGAYMNIDLELIAFPLINSVKNGSHIEGLRGDPENLYYAINHRGKALNGMWDWLKLGKVAMMPEKFKTEYILNNLAAIKDNLSTDNGKKIIDGAKDTGRAAMSVFSGENDIVEATSDAMHGIEKMTEGFTGVSSRIGHTFTVQILDTDDKPLINSKAPDCPLDFYISSMELDFSPHIVRIVNSVGKKLGACPEYCKINIQLTSVTKVTPDQMVKMCALR